MIFNVIFCHLQCHSQFQYFSTLLSFPVIRFGIIINYFQCLCHLHVITIPFNSLSPKCHHCSSQLVIVIIKVLDVSHFIKAMTSHYKFIQRVFHMEKTSPDLSVMSYFKEQLIATISACVETFQLVKVVFRILEREHIWRRSFPLDLICTKASTLTLNWLRRFLASHKRKLGLWPPRPFIDCKTVA